MNAKFSTYFFNVLVGAAFYNFSDEEIILRCIIFTASFYGVLHSMKSRGESKGAIC